MNPWSRLAGTALMLGVLVAPAFAEAPGLPPLPDPGDYHTKGYPAPAPEESQIPVPAPKPGVNLPDFPMPSRAPTGLEMGRILETLQKSHPEIFGGFGKDMSAETAAGVFTKVLERVRRVDPQSGMDDSPLGRISPETAENVLGVLLDLGASVQNGELQRGEVPEAMGRLLPPGLGDMLSQLRLQPQQVQQFQAILLDVVPQMMSGKPEDLKRMEGPLRDRLEGVFTKQQRDTLRNAERQLRETKD